MASKPKPPLVLHPAFACPLDEQQLMALGYISVVWGQIDYIVEELLMFANKFDNRQRKQFLTDKMIGTKLEMLVPAIPGLKPRAVRDDVKAFVAAIGRLKQKRNGAAHGLWGWKAHARLPARIVAAWHPKMLNNPVKASDLRDLAEELQEASKVGIRALNALLGFSHRTAVQFVWTPDSAGPPAWLTQLDGPFQTGRRPSGRRSPGPRIPPKAGP